jgi:hypothetical protein
MDKEDTPLFVIDPTPTIRWPVTVMMPVDGGETAKFVFTGIFNRLSEEELDELTKADEPVQTDASENAEEADKLVKHRPMSEILRGNAERLPRLLVGWDGVTDASGKPVEFSIELLKKQITGPNGQFLSIGLWHAVREIRHGARLGN